MSLEFKITLDASQIKKELDKIKEKIRDIRNEATGEIPDQEYTVSGTANSPDVPEVADQAYTVTGKHIPPHIPDVPDQEYTVTAKMNEKAPAAFFRNLKKGFKDFREELNKTESMGGKAFAVMLGGGLLELGMKALQSLGKIAVSVYDMWINGMREAGEMAQRNAASIRESAEESEKLRQKTDGYINSLATLAANEKLSNANKSEARRLIEDLTKSYGDLGVKLDETTGKLTGVDSAFVKKAQKDKERRIKELEAELKQIQADNKIQADLRDKAGVATGVKWGGQEIRLGGEATVKEATARIEENNLRAMEIRKKLHEQRQIDPLKELQEKRKAEIVDLKNARKEQQKTFERQKMDDAFADEKDLNKKIANRQSLLDQQRKEKITPLEEKVKNAQNVLQNAKGLDRLEAEKNLLQLQKELQSEYEKVYAIEREISGLKNEQQEKEKAEKEAKENLIRSAREQADLNKLLVNGSLDAYEAEKLRLELKKQGVNLTKAETDELLKQQKNLRTQNMNKSLLDKAQDLAWNNMKGSGQGLEAEKQKALLEAEKLKGGKLSSDEASLVSRLAELTHSAADQKQPDFGDTSIKTNSLTARGGFQGGAVLPDKDRINMVISASVKAMQQQQKEIRNLINDIKKALI